ncbi:MULTISPECIES: hypothetical protein [unclassified Prochlorococcus]|uniref:hypothetical protein n=1 Tax=unclassified Prochlorococcus TaxID=2627481 RepID=UPI000533B962|nr:MULTISPECIES: hypothetical protein [unclassified Prochlorococcus]KGG25551.1 DNA-3-methyladenine glycosylase II [Prochlorococcus sp. MIT 0702]KGG26517.1 DNA-3-methyladenine glycosylase II [Prochlorococcus sp. MIT 0701]KGG33271.1 DNA-3-methyladenine glycosylase II [Prochlorococcus sp. MIT 0703]
MKKVVAPATPIATQHIVKDFPALPQSFFWRPAEVVGPDLIGCRLVKRQADGSLLWALSRTYRHHAKGAAKCHWGSRMLKRLVQSSRSNRSKKKRVSPGQQQLPFAFDVRLNQIPEEWHQVALRFRRANGIRDGDRERRFWQLR